MKLLPRAAAFAAVTFCAGALANAATLEAQDQQPQNAGVQAVNVQEQSVVPVPPAVQMHPGEIVQPLPQAAIEDDQDFASLSAAVAAHETHDTADAELKCLAVGVYYESKGEPLTGQLAVAEVLLNRTRSGRFPKSICSVLTQRGQFSFIRRGNIPTPPANAHWRKAVAVAKIAQKDLWDSPAENALFFHSRYVKPSWARARVASIGNHVFYR
jgi:spore germination cell wall hydrolase CwlJ-like protein